MSTWTNIDELKPGDKVRADSGFDCIDAGAVLEVKKDDGGFYVVCRKGAHYLEGLLAIGFYKESDHGKDNHSEEQL